MGTILVGGILIVLVALAVFSLARDRKRGGCPGCSGSCHCESCEETASTEQP